MASSVRGVGFLLIGVCFAGIAVAQPATSQLTLEQRFERADKNGDGELDKTEVPPRVSQHFAELDSDQDGKINREELLSKWPQIQAVEARRGSSRRPGETIAPAARSERRPETLKAGDVAPEWTLPLVDGSGKLTLADLHKDKPLVMVFGSISCSPFRRQVEQVEELYRAAREHVNFVMIYIREAHPDSQIYVKNLEGQEVLQKFVQTDEADLRSQHAQACQRTLELSFPMVMDGVDNQVNIAYAGWPIRLVVVGTDGRIISAGSPGPQGFHPQEIAAWLRESQFIQ